MAGNRTCQGSRNLLTGVLALLLLLVATDVLAGERKVLPDVRRYDKEGAIRRLRRAGFRVGEIYEISTQRILATWKVTYPVGYVWMQNPDPQGGKVWDTDRPVDLMVSTLRDGKLPRFLREPAKPEAPAAAAPPTPASTAPGPAAKPPPGALPKAGPDPGRPAVAPEQGDRPLAVGSPDAPRVAPTPDPDHVPELVGLDLVAAEELVRGSKMTLYVERVAGHPVGKVLSQMPDAGTGRPAGGVVKVTATAGGDFEGDVPSAPAVYVAEITVPNILDRTRLQAERIAEDLGLTIQIEKAKRGLAGRVVDQMPAGGGRLPRGGVWRVWIGPGEDINAPGRKQAPGLGPLSDGDGPAPSSDAPKGTADPGKGDAPTPLSPGPLPRGVPQPVAPGVNTEIPHGDKVPVGFTWKGVQGAGAYILEVEEQGAEGRWMPLSRKPARTTAVLLDVERLDPDGASRLRWRVTAVISGRPGTPSKWVLLR